MFSSISNLFGLSDSKGGSRKDGNQADGRNSQRSPFTSPRASRNSFANPDEDTQDLSQPRTSLTAPTSQSSRATVSQSYITSSPNFITRNNRGYSSLNLDSEEVEDDASSQQTFTRMKLSDLSAPPAPAHDDAASSTQVPLNDFEAATVSNPGSLPHIRAGSVGQRSRAGSMALSSTAASLAAAYRDDDADALF